MADGGFDKTRMLEENVCANTYSRFPPMGKLFIGADILNERRMEQMEKSSEFVDCVYWGIFFNDDDFPYHLHENHVRNKHVTFGFKKPCPIELLGKKISVLITGYGCNDDNEAYEVSLPTDILKYYEGAYPMHITVSVSKNGKPVDSKDLPFWGVDKEFTIEGTIGYFGFDGDVHLSAPE